MGAGKEGKPELLPLNLMLCPPPPSPAPAHSPGCRAKSFLAQPSCVVWQQPKDKSRLQPETPSLLLSRQV